MSERTPPQYDDDNRTAEERGVDRAVKGTFPASDPPSYSAGTATPKGKGRAETEREKSEQEKDPDV